MDITHSVAAEAQAPARKVDEKALLEEVLAAIPSQRGRESLIRAFPEMTLRSLVRMRSIDVPWFGLGSKISMRTALHRYGLWLGMTDEQITHVLD
jgi:hypothetical protein